MVCQLFNHVRHCVTPWTVARQAPLSMASPRQEYWSGLPFIVGETKPEDVVPTYSELSASLGTKDLHSWDK